MAFGFENELKAEIERLRLTNAERYAIRWAENEAQAFAEMGGGPHAFVLAATLRKLLARTDAKNAVDDDIAQFWNEQRQNAEDPCTYPCHYCGDMCELKNLRACRMGFICYKCESEKMADPNDSFDLLD
jgi:hypothetical protein